MRIGEYENLAAAVAKKKPPEPTNDDSCDDGHGKRVGGRLIHSSASGSYANVWLFLEMTLFWPQRKNQGFLAAKMRAAKEGPAMIECHCLQTAVERTMERMGRRERTSSVRSHPKYWFQFNAIDGELN